MNFKEKNRKKANENIFRQKTAQNRHLPEKTRCAPPKTQRVWNWFFRNGTWGKLKMERVESYARPPTMCCSCGGADSRARHCTGETNGPSLKWQMPPELSLRGAKRRGNLGRHSQSVQAAVKTYRPIASVAALTERLVQGYSTAQGHWCTARHPDVSLRGAKRRGNLAVPG